MFASRSQLNEITQFRYQDDFLPNVMLEKLRSVKVRKVVHIKMLIHSLMNIMRLSTISLVLFYFKYVLCGIQNLYYTCKP